MRKALVIAVFSATSIFSTHSFGHDWNGLYAGVHAGYGWADSDTEAALAGASVALSADGDGFLGGIQAGFNIQSGNILWGVEADISRSSIDTSGTFLGDPEPSILGPVQGAGSVDGKIDWFGTLRLRAGALVTPNTLVYATGGLAYGRVEHASEGSLTFLAGPVTVPLFAGNDRDWETGWTVGGGAELALTGAMTLRAEYLYYDLGDSSYDAPAVIGAARIVSENNGHIVRAALNFKFDRDEPLSLK